MKLIMFTLMLLPAHVFAAQNWFPVGKAGANAVYSKKDSCVTAEGQECFEITGKDYRYHDVQTSNVDDPSKPIPVPPYNTSNCDSAVDCSSQIETKTATCNNGDYATYYKNSVLPGYTIHCTGVSGYEQMEVAALVENATLKASVQAADSALAAELAAIESIRKDSVFGNKMIGFVGVRIRSKSLSLADTKLVLSDYSEVMALLRAGSITHAKGEVTSMTPDGTRVSQADKDALLAELNAYLGQ